MAPWWRCDARCDYPESALHDGWLNLAAATLVQQTRFDPLHDQRHEAQLRERLPALAAEAQRTGQGHCTLVAGASELSLTLTRDHWLLHPARGRATRHTLRSLSAAMDDCALLYPSRCWVFQASAMRCSAPVSRRCSVSPMVLQPRASALQPARLLHRACAVPDARAGVRSAPASPARQPLRLQGDSAAAAARMFFIAQGVPIPLMAS